MLFTIHAQTCWSQMVSHQLNAVKHRVTSPGTTAQWPTRPETFKGTYVTPPVSWTKIRSRWICPTRLFVHVFRSSINSIYIFFYTILDVAILLPYIRSFSHHFSPHRQRFTEDRLAELVESEKNARYAQLLDLGRQVDHKNAEIVEMVRSQVRRLLQGKCQGARNR